MRRRTAAFGAKAAWGHVVAMGGTSMNFFNYSNIRSENGVSNRGLRKKIKGVAQTRERTEYLVEWTREGWKGLVKSKVYRSLKHARRRIDMMISEEPWKFIPSLAKKNPDECAICGTTGACLCGSGTIREWQTKKRASMPKIVYIALRERQVIETPWRLLESIFTDQFAQACSELTDPQKVVDS